MLFKDVIRRKRDGGALSDEQIQFFVDGLTDGSLPAEQVSALAMAIFINSMNFDEAGKLTSAMASSGTVLDWSKEDLGGPVVDKHSTGGVGDKVSFLLAPIAAACGCFVPMITGRGLGHTGGTTDKAESIPGYDATPGFDLFRKTVKQVGCCIVGQTEDLAPADRRLYSIRDVTGTVESVPLITASVLAKKVAAGLDYLVMDVKVGNGAFMESMDQAVEMVESIIATSAAADLRTHGLITDMNEVLGSTAGNALEIGETIRFLRNEDRDPRLNEVVMALCAEMVFLGGIDSSREAALDRCETAVSSGRAADIFGRMIAAMGGPSDLIDRYEDHLAKASVIRPVYGSGILTELKTRDIGNAIIELGGGRREAGETLDFSVGFSEFAPLGTELSKNRPLAIIHAANEADADKAEQNLLDACKIGESAPRKQAVIRQILTG